MQGVTTYQSYTNMTQSFQMKESRDYKVDSEQKFETPLAEEKKRPKAHRWIMKLQIF